MLKQVVLLSAILAIVASGTIREIKNPMSCYIKELDVVVPHNQTYLTAGSPGETAASLTGCLNYTCIEFYATRTGCTRLLSSKYFKEVEGDWTKPYPDCCPRMVPI